MPALWRVVGRMSSPPPHCHVCVLIPRSCENMRLRGKGELRLQMKLSLLVDGLEMGKRILDYPGGPTVVTRVLINGRKRLRDGSVERTWLDVAGLEMEG